MRIQLASDIHLEARAKTTFEEILEPTVAPILALLGDVAPLDHPNLYPFLEWCSERWETILWIPGKVEAFGSGVKAGASLAATVQEATDEMRRVSAPFWNIHVMDKEQFASSDGVLLLGCPLWKATPADGEEVHALYWNDLRWIQRAVRGNRMPVVVLTHVGPLTWMHEEEFAGDPEASMVLPDMELLLRTPIVAWAAGHCHQTIEAQKEWREATGRVGSVLFVSNPMGWPGQNRAYRRDAVLRIDPAQFQA